MVSGANLRPRRAFASSPRSIVLTAAYLYYLRGGSRVQLARTLLTASVRELATSGLLPSPPGALRCLAHLAARGRPPARGPCCSRPAQGPRPVRPAGPPALQRRQGQPAPGPGGEPPPCGPGEGKPPGAHAAPATDHPPARPAPGP